VDTLSEIAAADSSQASPDGEDGNGHHHSHAATGQEDYDNTDLSMINATSGELPDVDMTDVSSGAPVNLQSLTGDGKALLFWFWAPH